MAVSWLTDAVLEVLSWNSNLPASSILAGVAPPSREADRHWSLLTNRTCSAYVREILNKLEDLGKISSISGKVVTGHQARLYSLVRAAKTTSTKPGPAPSESPPGEEIALTRMLADRPTLEIHLQGAVDTMIKRINDSMLDISEGSVDNAVIDGVVENVQQLRTALRLLKALQ